MTSCATIFLQTAKENANTQKLIRKIKIEHFLSMGQKKNRRKD